MSVRLKTIQEAIKLANDLMDQKVYTYAERQAENKRKQEDNSRSNQNQQQPFKKQNVVRAYTAGSGDKKEYGGSLPKCTKCNYHHKGPCAPRCHSCNKVGHLARDCRNHAYANTANGTAGTNLNNNVITGMFLLNNHYASIVFDTGADRSFVSNAFSSLIDIIPTTLDHDYEVELADERITRVNTIIRGCTLSLLNARRNW
ncbi:putative reverse transcriptase domain-containing protein [Tanacetum coccineum]